LLRSLALESLGPVPADASNAHADDPAAASLGRRLFFDPKLSANGEVACASCHAPGLAFTDGRALSVGLGTTGRNAPTVIGAAYSPWQFWDGRRDSLWSQALAPLEARVEMGSTRLEIARYVTADSEHAAAYREVFGAAPDLSVAAGWPERASPFGDAEAKAAWRRLDPGRQRSIDVVFSNVGKAIEAYERRLVPGPSRFDRYVARLGRGGEASPADSLGDDELAGLRLFIDSGRTLCLRCHNGPRLTNDSFHDVATSRGVGLPDFGRFLGIQSLLLDPFNCSGAFSDAGPDDCDELRFLDQRAIGEQSGKFKTPTLRDVATTAPYLHDGRAADLEAVMEHYRAPPPSPRSEIVPLEISDAELGQIVAFLRTLDGGVAPEAAAWAAPPPSRVP
jgi:cytochrome c peroxidase